MITGVEGLPGSGKTYLTLEQLYSSLARGKTVYTNMRNIYIGKIAWSIHRASGVSRKAILERFKIIDPWDLENIYEWWDYSLYGTEIFLDEVMVTWLSRDWAKMDRRVIEWFSQHRKYRTNFTYVAQSIDKIDGTLRDMTQKFITMRNTAFWKFSIFRLPQMFLAIHYAEDRKNILKREWIIPIKKYYDFYDSWALFPTRKEAEIENKGNVVGFSRGARPGGPGGARLEGRSENG